ncbi:MAG: ankyrin repeat domain-containing protein, partial [Chloroflexota bacterium]|nr:ankyrin repeat domain-containing protein [Chloroflexota bacterium]
MTTAQSIHEAATQADLATAQALLAATPALANTRDEHGWVPLFHAGHYGHKQLVELLLAHGADAHRPKKRPRKDPMRR